MNCTLHKSDENLILSFQSAFENDICAHFIERSVATSGQ